MIPMTNAPSKKLGPGCPLLLPFRRAQQLCLPRDARVQRIQPQAFSKDQPWKTWIRCNLSHKPRTPPYLNPEESKQYSVVTQVLLQGYWSTVKEGTGKRSRFRNCIFMSAGQKRTSSGISLKHLQATWEMTGTREHQEMQTTPV